ncbi:hypothetical protein MUG84_01845 [Paenibacillus sp. KQZ6P-2]|uniref:O-antigen ligase domain-containing protein n=1 Tax=Paenibacillus mangrovi TaxID=2931978 RepID=A0A9X1WJG9_9BACL|nr:hypothetical protein [Paenibacillus mangrovi]MCJ8010482.1 hypothetical protein [Paenibacillus mangrovi]
MEIIIALTYVFHQAISPNLDLFYFLSIALIGKDILQRKTITLKAMGYVYLIILYALLQLILNDSIEIQRLIINIAKIFVNVFLFLQVREIFLPQLSLKKILDTVSVSYFVLLLVGLVYKTDLLWRLDDQVNIYQTLRFSLLYFEPSEASFHVCIVIILLMYYVLREKDIKRNCLNLLLVISNAIIVILTAGMGGILGVTLALVVMYLCYLREKISVERVLMFIALFITCSFAIFIFITSSNGFYLRINDIAAGRDGSVLYRFNTSFEVMKQMLLNTNFLGIGFGNLNTSAIQGGYAGYGLVEVISNSFMYVIAEGGIAMIILLIVFHIEMIRRIRIDERILKYSLLIFIFSYQIAGGYFTNPINWIVYGLIANTVFMRKDLLQCNFQVYRSTIELKNNM